MAAGLWGWVALLSPGTFHDQGGMSITFVILPLTLVLWIVGGPVALVVGVCGVVWARSAPEQWAGKRLARAGVLLSGLTVLCGLGLVAALVAIAAATART
jgi:hypothetical protein